MDRGNLILQFTDSLIELSRLVVQLKDEFFIEKIRQHEEHLVTAFVENDFMQRGNDHNVAQYKGKELLSCVEQIISTLTDLQYLNFAPAAPLLRTQRFLLTFKLSIIESIKSSDKPAVRVTESPVIIPADTQKKSKAKRILNENQERIIKFVRLSERTRTKEIIEEFSSLSERTVKRNLKELVSQGFLKRRSENKAVYYSAS